jgi:hypothetical protein
MRAWVQLATIGALLSVAAPAGAAPTLSLRVEHEAGPPAMLVQRVRALLSAVLPAGAGRREGLQLTTSVGGPASRERLEGRLETTTKLVKPQLGCWHGWSRGFFLGLELGWAVASSSPGRSQASEGDRNAGLAGLARPTASILHFGWSR